MPATLYNCPTSQFDRTEVNKAVERQELKRINTLAPSFDAVTLECHSPDCDGNTVFTINPGESVACPKCKSRSDAFRLGEFQGLMTPLPDAFDSADYGDDVLHLDDLDGPTVEELDAIEQEQVQTETDNRIHQARATICRQYRWDWNICKAIFTKAIDPTYFKYLQSI